MSIPVPQPIHNIFPSTSMADAKKDPLLFLGPTFLGLTILCLILHHFFCFSFLFQLFCTKTLNKHIWTSVWSGQHPNAGLNKGCLNWPKHGPNQSCLSL